MPKNFQKKFSPKICGRGWGEGGSRAVLEFFQNLSVFGKLGMEYGVRNICVCDDDLLNDEYKM